MNSRNIDVAYLNRLTAMIIGAAIEVHRYLGPGLLESAYELSGCPLGLLLNFNVPLLKDGIRRFRLDK